MIELFECVRLSARISKAQCQVNRFRVDNSRIDVLAISACKGCPGLGAAVNIVPEVVSMAKNKCSVAGCVRQAQHGMGGMCKSHFKGTVARNVKRSAVVSGPLPVVSAVESDLVDRMDTQDAVLSDMRTALVRKFDTGATRSGGNKPEYAGYLSPRVIEAFGRYMFEHQAQPDGTVRESRNWQKGIPQESYVQSMFRHFMEVWTIYERTRGDVVVAAQYEQELLTALMAMFFNVQGMAHELIGAHGGVSPSPPHGVSRLASKHFSGDRSNV